jgi:hypothetical protein
MIMVEQPVVSAMTPAVVGVVTKIMFDLRERMQGQAVEYM